MKVLGVTITNTLDWSENTAILVKKVNMRKQLLRSVWGLGSSISEMVHLWKLYYLSVLEQSCVVWGGSLTTENKEDLERTQKSFCKLVLRDSYHDYESALLRLDLEKLDTRRQNLMLKFAKNGIANRKLHDPLKLRQTTHNMHQRHHDAYRTTKVHTERFKNSSILFMERLLNNDARLEQQNQ